MPLVASGDPVGWLARRRRGWTAYPRFKRLITAHELHLFFSPTREELEWAADATDSDEHLLALLLMLKSYRRMGCVSRRWRTSRRWWWTSYGGRWSCRRARCRCTGRRGRPSITVAWSASGSA